MLRTQQARATGLAGDFDGRCPTPRRDRVVRARRTGHARPGRVAIERGRVLNSTGEPGRRRRRTSPTLYGWRRRRARRGWRWTRYTCRRSQRAATDGPRLRWQIDERALAEIEASDDPQVRRWLGSILNNLGWDLHDSGRPEEALAVFERAVEVRPRPRTTGWVVRPLVHRPHAAHLGRYDEALALMRELAADPFGAEDEYVHEEIAENEKALGRAL